MKKLIQQNHDVIVLWGVLIALVLIGANLFKHEVITLDLLASNKDAIQAISSASTAFIVMIGAFLTYYRFFKGRTFSSRAQIEIEPRVHKLDENENVHIVKVNFKNVGTSAIFSPKLKLKVDVLGGGVDKSWIIDRWYDPGKELDNNNHMYFIDAEEVASFLTHVHIPGIASLVVYTAIVTSDDNVVWQDGISVTNSTERGDTNT